MATVKSVIEQNETQAVEIFKQKIASLKMEKGPSDKLVSMFKSAFCPSKSADSEIVWSSVVPLNDSLQYPYESLSEPEDPVSLLKQLIVIKLNGGLGTTMGCTFPKSLVQFREGKTFFDVTVEEIRALNQKYHVDVPLVLMHSFYTDELMKPHIQGIKGVKIYTFNQNKFPRIYEDTLEPVPNSPQSPLTMWNPPGHGDVYHSLRDCGLLDKFISEGKRFMMVSNIDNLGALVDLKILNKVAKEDIPYIAETVTKTIDDWKGGMPIMYKGQLKLLETAQVPAGHMDDFCNMNFLDYFHANNLWVNLAKLKAALDADTLKLDVIKNKKTFEGRPVVQLEAACGSAIQSFPDSRTVRVPRKRFLPVKSCNELLLMRSDVYIETNGEFVLNPTRITKELPSIKLGPKYSFVSEFEKRFPAPPSLVNLNKLVVDGDVTFGKGIVIEGNVEIKAPAAEKWIIPDGKHLKDVVITSASQI